MMSAWSNSKLGRTYETKIYSQWRTVENRYVFVLAGLTLLLVQLLTSKSLIVIGTVNALEQRLEDIITPNGCVYYWLCGKWPSEALV